MFRILQKKKKNYITFRFLLKYPNIFVHIFVNKKWRKNFFCKHVCQCVEISVTNILSPDSLKFVKNIARNRKPFKIDKSRAYYTLKNGWKLFWTSIEIIARIMQIFILYTLYKYLYRLKIILYIFHCAKIYSSNSFHSEPSKMAQHLENVVFFFQINSPFPRERAAYRHL